MKAILKKIWRISKASWMMMYYTKFILVIVGAGTIESSYIKAALKLLLTQPEIMKAEIVNWIHKLINEFEHIETGLNLDRKMYFFN